MKNGTYFPGRGTLIEETFLEGKSEGLAESVLLVLQQCQIPISDEAQALIMSERDHRTLKSWLIRTLTVSTVDELFTNAG